MKVGENHQLYAIEKLQPKQAAWSSETEKYPLI